jgi:ankyrin repeat protein
MNKKHLSTAVLLQRGANAEMAANHGSTALMYSAWHDSRECTTLLLRHGVAVDAINSDGRTALSLASYYGHLSLMELLVEGGSDIEIAGNNGLKARDVATGLNRTSIVEYLHKDKRWQRRSGLAMVRSSIRDVEDQDRGPIIRALQCDDVAREIGSFL